MIGIGEVNGKVEDGFTCFKVNLLNWWINSSSIYVYLSFCFYQVNGQRGFFPFNYVRFLDEDEQKEFDAGGGKD